MRYKAIWNVKAANGKRYAPGDEFELPESEAANALKLGAIEPIIKPFSRKMEKTAIHIKSLES